MEEIQELESDTGKKAALNNLDSVVDAVDRKASSLQRTCKWAGFKLFGSVISFSNNIAKQIGKSATENRTAVSSKSKRMPNQRKKSSERSLCPQYVLEEARRRIENGESKRKVASSYGMKESTLRYRLKRKGAATKLGRYDATLSPEIEQEFCNYLEDLDNMFQGMTPKNLRIAAYEFVVKNNIPHRFNAEKKMAGKHWLRGFLSRHPDLSLRRPTSTSIARAMGFNKPQCERFYKNLAELMDKYKFPPTSIYNMDETGLSTVPNNPPRVISKKGKRAVNKISSAERGTNVTVVNAMSASGHFIPPAFIFGRKRMKAELLDGAPPASIGMVSDTSYINSELFLNWLGHFKDHTRPTKEHPILLVLDNHVSHCTIGAVCRLLSSE
ncbi:unnamed protein product [Acanthoscelides obtectus]|uniref:HTH CENPB-type domain-containing protein n=1 Tax=Acanthoscelides obtectus TaxID=200917 RepID=A0A9P0LRB2_ACAOB|nr:unnamed protein product [Acanthoscelides obtectus]CAK1662762.1 hypothetical protein AOBTE_LOCUS23295 [Acanthoscelides obtectus]